MKAPKEQPPTKTSVKVPSEDVLQPPPCDKADVEAVQAVAAGTANEAQQRRAIDWIIHYGCGTYDEPYRSERPHDAIFAVGRASAGRNILRLLRIKLGKMKED